MQHAALHTVSFVHGCFTGKCIVTGSREQRYFKVDGNMEKKWDTVIPADLKRLFINGTCTYVLLVTKGLSDLFLMFSTWKINCCTFNSVVNNSECIASNDQVVLNNE
jgi:hypothetical protein